MTTSSEQLAHSIVERLQSAGYVAYYAGGCVRDRLMGRMPKDFDVATSATPEQVLAIFPKSQQVGAAFGVILVHGWQEADTGARAQVEVATFRADGAYTDGRHPDSVRFTTAEEDAKRRDFTCNGLFFDPLANQGTGEIHDFVGGRQDIKRKILRAIGNADDRFAEDHLRMLRAIRFAAKLGFAMDDVTFHAIQTHAMNIRTVSKERVHDELALILTHESRGEAARLLQSSRLLKELWPEELFPDPALPRYFEGYQLLPPAIDFVMALFALYKTCAWSPEQNPGIVPPSLALGGPAVARLLRRDLLLNNVETDDLAWLLDQNWELVGWSDMPKARLKRLLADPRWPRLATLFIALSLNPELLDSFNTRIAQLQAEGVAPTPFVDGQVLIKLGAHPGPKFRGWLDQLYDRQLENEFPNSAAAIEAARKLIQT